MRSSSTGAAPDPNFTLTTTHSDVATARFIHSEVGAVGVTSCAVGARFIRLAGVADAAGKAGVRFKNGFRVGGGCDSIWGKVLEHTPKMESGT